MELSWETLTLISTFLDKEEVFSLRRVCKYWNRTLTPVLCHTLIYDPFEKDQAAHKAFLKKYGVCAKKLVFGFLGLGNIFVLSESDIEFISSSFPKLTTLEYNISEMDPDKAVLALHEIGNNLPRLKRLDLRGVVDGAALKLLNSLFAKLQVVSLGKILQRDGSKHDDKYNELYLLPYLELPLAKELRIFDEGEDGGFCNSLVQKFTGLDTLQYFSKDYYDDLWMLIDVKKSAISHAQLSSSEQFRVTFEFDTMSSKLKHHLTDYTSLIKKIKDIRYIINGNEDEVEFDATFPPIKSLHLRCQLLR
ncbi:hypothetical protein DSO57_1013574 [Entomophthora muscae]|uniref:Uncharacterized protein n=1 Tax=Entomophthora muscae TaxID=34485 RepID=A0ACC2S7N8_9FUNG|nr:hypothetical protein DSO57_1013574 [Entomophthora muscae]